VNGFRPRKTRLQKLKYERREKIFRLSSPYRRGVGATAAMQAAGARQASPAFRKATVKIFIC
jgi:hypothetical protein